MNEKFSHIDDSGKAQMVDVGMKPVVQREASATGLIVLQSHTLSLIESNQMKKGDVLTVAEIAGIQAAKRTHELIPLCHSILLSKVQVRCSIEPTGVRVNATVACSAQTGVEMEALTAVSIALLTIYDMCKAVDKEMRIVETRLLEKFKA